MAAKKKKKTAAVPERIGSFRVDRLLGEGCMSKVYLAHDDTDEVRVALKVCVTSAVQKADWAGKIQTQIEHPNLMQYRGLPFDSQHQYLVVMDYLDVVPATFERLLSRTFEEIVDIYAKAADALAFLEDQGHVHGNVKPTNIQCRRAKDAFYPMVADAGLHYVYDPKHICGDVASRIFCYMAPEHLEEFVGEPKNVQPVSSAGDVYSLCVALIEAMTGSTPFQLHVEDPSNVEEVLAAKRKKRYRVIFKNDPTTPLDAGKLGEVLHRGLDPTPSVRPRMAEMGRLLRETIDQGRLAALTG